MTVLADSPPRSRKRPKPSFDAPADVTSAPESGWVFRSDAPADAISPARVAPAASSNAESEDAGLDAAEPAPQAPVEPVVMAPVIASESPLRFAWVPLAIGYSTILAMLPRRRREGVVRDGEGAER
jgi:hypothetical protein